MELILSVIGILLGLLGYNFVKRRSAEALLENNETNKKLNEQDKAIARDSGLLQAEEAKRKQIEEEMKKKGKDATAEDLNTILN